jgi:hypothetical protein
MFKFTHVTTILLVSALLALPVPVLTILVIVASDLPIPEKIPDYTYPDAREDPPVGQVAPIQIVSRPFDSQQEAEASAADATLKGLRTEVAGPDLIGNWFVIVYL